MMARSEGSFTGHKIWSYIRAVLFGMWQFQYAIVAWLLVYYLGKTFLSPNHQITSLGPWKFSICWLSLNETDFSLHMKLSKVDSAPYKPIFAHILVAILQT